MSKRAYYTAFPDDSDGTYVKTPKRRVQPPLEVAPVTSLPVTPPPPLPLLPPQEVPPATQSLLVRQLPEDCVHEIGLLLPVRDAMVCLYGIGSRTLLRYRYEYMSRRWQMGHARAGACLRQLAGIAEFMTNQDATEQRAKSGVSPRERRYKRLGFVVKFNCVDCLRLLMPAIMPDADAIPNAYNKRFITMLSSAISSGFRALVRSMFVWLAEWRLFDVMQDQLALFDRAAKHKDGPMIVWLADKLGKELQRVEGSQYQCHILFNCLRVCHDEGMAPGFIQFVPETLLIKVAVEASVQHWPTVSFACLPLGSATFSEGLRTALTRAGRDHNYEAIREMWSQRAFGV